ncbi:Uma2 family endonuclease [Chroococcus sp. FPU101]|uniref:Uma2 family endonuclease n=1 Tax=Chroococcus sp. FPU101 TaxID=1974212 RepID=UPI001A8D32A7|nr:Uma2 family endonuclease [Chroococcus sp. FPU101]
MTQAVPKYLSFEEYLEQYPEDGGRYELIDGRMIEVLPIADHEDIGGFLSGTLFVEYTRLQLPYFIPRSCGVKPHREATGYIPDVIVLNRDTIVNDPYWKKASSITLGESACLVIEIVSNNWRDDYIKKFDDYEALGFPEYWIIEYLAKGSARFIATPKTPTISVCHLIDGEYQVNLFKGNQTIISPTFPELDLTAAQIFQAQK